MIGNSRGIRIPKIIPAQIKKSSEINTLMLSERSLEVDWNRPEEDEAWASLQIICVKFCHIASNNYFCYILYR